MSMSVGRRWSAIGVGFIGVLMIIRPGFEGFKPESLFVVASVIAIATRDLITRRLDTRVASSVVAMQAYVAVGVTGVILMAFTAQPVIPLQSAQIGPYIGAVRIWRSGILRHRHRHADRRSLGPDTVQIHAAGLFHRRWHADVR